MRFRKFTAVVCIGILFLGCVLLYRMADRSLSQQDNALKEFPENNWVHVKDVLKPVGDKSGVHRGKLISVNKPPPSRDKPITCSIPSNEVDADIQMLEVYKELKFDNLDGGVWKQGWNVDADLSRWNPQHKLKVFVVPHSHNDPGWLKTFDDYYSFSTHNILNTMLEKMTADPRKKFIWAEISYFSLWWDELSAENQRKAKRLVENGQLEIVTGGWVMNDEANAHYFSILTQLTEGHQWIKSNLGVLPRNSWCIDPFGKSSTMPYVLNKMGLKNLVIQRVHYSIKKYLAQSKNLEFRWRQMWDNGGDTDLMTHMMPFYSYDVPHTCGPDPKVCCQFDFKRLPGHGLSCPWKVPPRPINNKNVAARAQMLLDQYQKKAELYRTNVILVPLGDDFRYEYSAEWDNQFDNYFALMDYFDNHPELNAEVKFGTLEDFFSALLSETAPDEFPSLYGDFFTYADRDDHYWSGYFTSRPFHKRMDRVLLNYMRTAEIAYVLAWGTKPSDRSDWLLSPQAGFSRMLRDARRSLSLFQHHDGVTGTARDHVMEDYGRRMLEAIGFCQHVLQQSMHFLLSPRDQPYIPDGEQVYFDVDDHRRSQNSLPERKLLIFRVGETKRVIFFNSLGRRRQEVVSIFAFSRFISITDGNGAVVACQTSPVFSQGSVMDQSRYEISFIVDVPAFGIASYTVTYQGSEDTTKENTLAKVTVFNSFGSVKPSLGFESLQDLEAREFSIENSKLRAAFTDQGQLKSLTIKEGTVTVPLHIDFVSLELLSCYRKTEIAGNDIVSRPPESNRRSNSTGTEGTTQSKIGLGRGLQATCGPQIVTELSRIIRYLARGGTERSGAYLFLPAGEAVPVREESPVIRVVEGSIVSSVDLVLQNVKHSLTLYNSPGADGLALEISNLVDISKENNYELAMRLSSRIRSLDEFYTDLNGFQITKRKRFAKIPLQGNFYPLPAAAYIEDETQRLTLLTAQPLGVASLKEGQLEILQDRRLQQDDNRGLGQGVLDNVPTVNLFRILVEQRSDCKGTPNLLSSAAHMSYSSMIHKIIPQIWKPETPCDLNVNWAPGDTELPPDVELVTARTLDEDMKQIQAGLVFHRTHLDTCVLPTPSPAIETAQVNVGTLLPEHFGEKMNRTSLSFLTEEKSYTRSDDLPLCHMDFLAVVIDR